MKVKTTSPNEDGLSQITVTNEDGSQYVAEDVDMTPVTKTSARELLKRIRAAAADAEVALKNGVALDFEVAAEDIMCLGSALKSDAETRGIAGLS